MNTVMFYDRNREGDRLKGAWEKSKKFPTAGILQKSLKTKGETMIFLAAADCKLEEIQAHFGEQLTTPSRCTFQVEAI